jgi:hypothetical protein
MPLMQDLLAQIQKAPPQTEAELEKMLDETGYDLVMKETGGEEKEEAYEDEGEEEEKESLCPSHEVGSTGLLRKKPDLILKPGNARIQIATLRGEAAENALKGIV